MDGLQIRRIFPKAAIVALLLLVNVPNPTVAQAVSLTVNAAAGTIVTGASCPNPRTSAVYKTVQAAVDCAEPGDSITVAAGTYFENVSVEKDLSLQGEGAATTIINGGGIGRTMTVDAAVTVSLSRLTLTNGSAPDGGGLYSSASTLDLTNVILSNNSASTRGGGLFTAAGSIRLTGGSVFGNQAGYGGGIYTLAGTVKLIGGSIYGNTAISVGGGTFTEAGTVNTTPGAVVNNNAVSDAQIHTLVGAVNQAGTEAVIGGVLVLEGRPAAPNPRWMVPVQVTIVPDGSLTTVFDQTVTTDNTGGFIAVLTPGTYRIRVKGSHTLARAVTATITAGSNSVNVPTLLEGDANDSNTVTILDFSILAAAFGKVAGQAGYDARADFNGDNAVTILDFSLLAANFGKAGESL